MRIRSISEGDDGEVTVPASDADDELARRCAEVMWADDEASRRLGMTLDAIGSGRAALSMAVRDDMTNGHGTAHGGFIFALADSAFAFACNSYNERTVAQACDIVFVAPAHEGDVLVADATERHRFGRNGVYDIRVTCGDQVIAEFRGRSRTIGGTLIDTAPPDTAPLDTAQPDAVPAEDGTT